MRFSPSQVWPFLKDLGADVVDDDCPAMSAAIAYYTVFSLPPLLVILVALAGLIFGPEAVTDAIVEQVRSSVGEGTGEEIRTMIEQAGGAFGGSWFAKLGGLVALLFGATGAFAQLQQSLNRAWEVEPDPEQGGLKAMIFKRILSLGMVVTIAFFLLVSLVLSAAIAAVGTLIDGMAISGWMEFGLQLASFVVSLGIITALFAAMFKVLPDAEVAWKDVWQGAFFTALLFTVGKTLIGIYLAKSDPGSSFGAAGSLVLLLVWIQYSALIVLIGAEFTQLWATRYGTGIKPDEDAVRVVEREDHDRSHQGAAGKARDRAEAKKVAAEKNEDAAEAAETGYPAEQGEADGADAEKPYQPGDHPWAKPRDPEPF